MQESKPSDLNLTAFHVKWWVLTSFAPRGSQIKPYPCPPPLPGWGGGGGVRGGQGAGCGGPQTLLCMR